MNKEDLDEFKIEEINEFEPYVNTDENEANEVQWLTEEETEETEGGKYYVQAVETFSPSSWLANDSAKKGYKKHCGGLKFSTSNPSITVERLGLRIGQIDKIFVAPGSIPVRCSIVNPSGGIGKITVSRRAGKLGLVTIEAWGHQKNEPKNYRYAVLRVQFN